MSKLLKNIKAKASDVVSNVIATWLFVAIYTVVTIVWVALHSKGIMSIDSRDYTRYNLFLNWFAGIQASIVLMASARQSERDRKNIIKGIELDKQQLARLTQDQLETKKTTTKLNKIIKKMETLEDILSMIEKEEDIVRKK